MHNNPQEVVSQDYRIPFLLLSINDHLKCFETCPYATSITAWSEHFQSMIVIALTCKRWGCRYCGSRKSFALGLRVQLAKPTRLITLTINPKMYITRREAYEETRRKIPELAKVVRRETGEFEYLRVLEVTKLGWPHYHLVARCGYIKQKWISHVWNNLTGAPIVDIRIIKRTDHIGSYVMKYLCKQKYIPWTNRRVSWSKNFFPKVESTEKGKWQLKSRNWKNEHPMLLIQSDYTGSVCTKVGADVWLLNTPDQEALNVKKRKAAVQGQLDLGESIDADHSMQSAQSPTCLLLNCTLKPN